MNNHNKKRAEGEAMVRDWSRSGKSRRAWCIEAGISYSRFIYWERKLRRELATQQEGETDRAYLGMEAKDTETTAIQETVSGCPDQANLTDEETMIQTWKQSGLSRRAWCKKVGISYSRFLYQERKRTMKGSPHEAMPLFIAVVPDPEDTTLPITRASPFIREPTYISTIQVNEPTRQLRVNISLSGLSIDVPDGYRPETLISLVETLRALC